MITYDNILNKYELEVIDPELGRETLLFNTRQEAEQAAKEWA